MVAECDPVSAAATQTAQRLLRDANVTANSSKKLLHRVRSKLQAPKSDVTIATIVDHVDSIDTRSLEVLRALLEVLEPQVSAEKYQALQHRLLVVAAKRGHHEILEYLHHQCANIDYSHGEALEIAVLYGHLPCVKVLLSRTPSVHNTERALFTTDFVDVHQARETIKLLLGCELPHAVLEYLILKIHAASGEDHDAEILDMLVEATNRNDQQSEVAIDADFASLYAYFEIQKHTRNTATYKGVSSGSFKSPVASVQVTELRKPHRNIFGDETIKTPENVVVKLLARYLTDCSTAMGSATQWSLYNINLLLDKLPCSAEERPEYTQSLFLAASFQQETVFTRLLHYRPTCLRTLNSLHLQVIAKSPELTVALVDCLNQHFTVDEHYRTVIELLFAHTCEAQLIPTATQICSRSRVRISISPVRKHLKVAIASEEHAEDLAELLKVTKVEESDLDVLWEYVLVSIDFPTNAARMLLRAGYKSLIVARTFLRCVRFNEEISKLSMILEEWKTVITPDLREEFDYSTREPVSPRRTGFTNPDSQYFSTLATAMSIIIERQQSVLCQLLLDRGAPLVLDGKSLLGQAIRHGAKDSALDQDDVLRSIVDNERRRTGTPMVLDYALLQSVKSQRSQLATDLIGQGASTIAYNYELWQVVFRSENQTMLCSLLATTRASLEFSKNFMAIFASFDIDPKVWLTLCAQLHQAGYVNPKCYSWVLSVLCLCNKATVQSAEQLLEYGASNRDEIDQCLEQCWLHGNLPIFRVLSDANISQKAAENLFQSMTRSVADFTNRSSSADGATCGNPKSTMVYDAMNLLLQRDMPKRLRNAALCSVAVSYKGPIYLRVPLLKSLLERDARFSEDDGLALLHCLFIDDKQLVDQVNVSRPPVKARQAALQFCLHFPSGMCDPAPSHRFHALAQLLYPLPSIPSIKLSDRSVIDITGIFLSPNSDTPTTLIHHFYGWLRNRTPSGLSDLEHCWAVEKKLNTIFEALVDSKDRQMQFIERITAVLAWTRPEPVSAIAAARYCDSFWLPRVSLSRYLVEASKAGLTPVVGALLEAGISPNAFDSNGRSALFWATSMNEPTVVLLLIDAGADLDDGSLHEAMCQQHQAVMKLLLKTGHDRMCISTLHDDTTPLLAFMQFDHSISKLDSFPVTVNILLNGQAFTPEFCKDLKLAVEAAISNHYSFKLILALLPWLRKSFDAQREIFEEPIARGPLRYSLLSLIDRWEYNGLSRSQRNSLVLSLQGVGFEETFYTVEGDQPANAINVPEAIRLAEKTRKRRAAFETKECCICGDKAENETEIHADLAPTCAASHGWKGDIVCTDCLKQYLESRMFPHDDVSIKYKFPSTRIPCWAPKCVTTELPYNVLREYSDPEIFHLYDLALCQALLREGKSMVKCATLDCPGAHWHDEDDVEESLKIFFCDLCFQNTCMECNDLYEKHDGRPCPAGEEARKSERIKLEEKLSEEALKNEKRCPKCKLMYQKYFGCDHIVCGKNVYDNKVDKGCRFEFCDICFGAWPHGHTRRCVHRM